ncbi:MAG: hypothetical protein N3A54_04200 [Patescibacteria group bacterium]|nr:hypothetical protein [Patescibacteria group bacterium]
MKIINSFFLFSVQKREAIIGLFKIFYGIFSLFIIAACIIVYHNLHGVSTIRSLSSLFGKIAIIFYLLTLIPGIARRFRVQHKLIAVLMMYRRHLGILSFFFMLYHYLMERGVDLLRFGPPTTIAAAEFFGMTAFFIAFLLTITSNDISTKTLGIWWHRLHALTYVMVWCVFFHIALHRISVWTVLVGLFGILEILSLVWRRR